MNQLGLLLKYKLKMWSNIPKRRGRHGMPLFAYVLILAGVFAIIGIPAYFLFVETFKTYSTIIFGGVSLADLFVEISMIGILVLVLVTDTPAIALNVFMSDDVDFLLSLPISQSTIFSSKAIETMIQGGFPALFVIPVLAAYANSVNMSWYEIIFMFVMYIFYFLILTAISSLIALGVSKFASRSGTQRFMILTSLIVYVFVIILMGMVGSLNSNAGNVEMAFSNYVNTVNAPYLPSTWFLDALKMQWSGILLVIGTSIALSAIAYLVASNGILTGFSKMTSASKRTIHRKKYRIRRPVIAFISKDVKLMRREPSILFLLIYPAIFPLILVGVGALGKGENALTRDIMIPVVSVFLSSMYTVIATASLVSIEIKVGDFVNTLPIGKRTPLWSKAFVITSAFAIVMIVTFSILSAIFGNVLFPIVTVLFSIPILLTLSFFGVYATIKWPNSIGGIRRPLNTTGTLVSMGMGFLGATFADLEGIYIGQNQILSFLNPVLEFFVFFAAPVLAEIVMAIVTFKLLSKIDWTKPYDLGN
jgi:predicted permease